MTRREILAQKIMLLAQRLVEAEAPYLEALNNLEAMKGIGRGGELIWVRHERRLQTLRKLLAERIRLEKDEKAHPLTPYDEGTWLDDLHGANVDIIDRQADRLYQGIKSDVERTLAVSPEPWLIEAKQQFNRLRLQYLQEAEILDGEREHRKKAPVSGAPTQTITLNISNSQVAGLNVAGTVGSIQATVNALRTDGAEKLADALKALAEAIARAEKLGDGAKRESLELVSAMGDEITGQRRHVIMRSLGETLKGLLIHAGEAYGAYEGVKLAVKMFFGYDLP